MARKTHGEIVGPSPKRLSKKFKRRRRKKLARLEQDERRRMI